MSYVLNTNDQSQTIYLDSTNCASRKPTFRYHLQTAISAPPSMRVLLSVQQVTFPNVIQNVNTYNNTLSYDFNGKVRTYEFPVGIYSAWSWRDYFNAISPETLMCSYANFTFTFFSSYSFSIINTSVNPTTCGALIECSKDDNNHFIFPQTASVPYFTLVMPSTVNFIYSPYVFLKVNELQLSNINSHGIINNCLTRIPVNSRFGELVQYRPAEINRFLISQSHISYLDFALEDVHNNPLSIPSGAELQVVLKIEFIYPPATLPYDMGTMAYNHRMKTPEDPVVPDEGL